MKYIYFLFSAVFVTAIFSNCAGNKELEKRAPAQFQQAYFTSTQDSIKLYIPVVTIQSRQVALDSVYFRGFKTILLQDEKRPGVYFAQFYKGNSDLIMSSDPKEEYANKMPQKAVKVPFKLQDDEAVIVFTQKNKTKYFKISGIKERSEEQNRKL
jgi:hypothetical protein